MPLLTPLKNTGILTSLPTTSPPFEIQSVRVYSNPYNFKLCKETQELNTKFSRNCSQVVSSQFRLVHNQETVRHMLMCKIGVANTQELRNPASESCSSNNRRKTVNLKKTNLEKRCNFRVQYTVSTNRYP